jgi:hypothetical protein
MKKIYMFTTITLCLISLMIVHYPCMAETLDREQIGEYGFIDWLNLRVYAKGVGIFPENKTNMAQAQAMAQRAALVVAQRNLLGVIYGVHIDSKTVIENRIAQDDTIVSKIEGLVQFCQVEDTQMLSNRSIEVIVSMPILGKLGKVLVDAIEETAGRGDARPPQDVEFRLKNLENRMRMLEERISELKKVSVQKEDLVYLFQRLSAAWQDYAAGRAVISHAGYASDAETAAIRNSLDNQEKQLASLSIHMEDLARRLSAIEETFDKNKTIQPAQPSKATTPYTGLIVDARHTNFKPCLKPGLFINGEAIYPGAFLDTDRVVTEGYVRYYSDPQQAQQSARVGSLPYVVKAIGTYEGDRGLSLSDSGYPVLKTVLQNPDNFLAQARVVIIF